MRETGVIPPRARVELLAGILVDMHRPTARELEATRRIAGVLAEDVRFNVRDFDRMLEIGILADVQRHELLDGVVLDLDVDAQARAARVAADVAARLPWSEFGWTSPFAGDGPTAITRPPHAATRSARRRRERRMRADKVAHEHCAIIRDALAIRVNLQQPEDLWP